MQSNVIQTKKNIQRNPTDSRWRLTRVEETAAGGEEANASGAETRHRRWWRRERRKTMLC